MLIAQGCQPEIPDGGMVCLGVTRPAGCELCTTLVEGFVVLVVYLAGFVDVVLPLGVEFVFFVVEGF